MGVVFLARDVALERPVAIKLLLPHLAHDATLRERFLREARTAAQLMHPNIVPIHAVEAHRELVFFVMSYVDGETLAQRVARAGRATPDEVLRVMRDVAWALAYAHARGVVHRDIKPDNILVERQSGRALVADFGIAHLSVQETFTEPGAFVGTVQYMSPEQACGETVDGRSDVYSLAATAYFQLTGESPVQAPTMPAMLARLVSEHSPNVALARPDTPSALAEVISRAMERDRTRRTASADVLASELQRLEQSAPTVRPEIRRYLKSMDLLEFLAMAGAGAALPSLLFFNSGEMPRTVLHGVLTLGTGFVAMYALLAPAGLLGLRSQGVSWRELVEGLDSEGRESARVSWMLWRRAIGASPVGVRWRLRVLGLFVLTVYVGGAVGLMALSKGDSQLIPTLIALAIGGSGAWFGSSVLLRSFRPQGEFERWLEKPRQAPLRLRVLGWFARRPFVQRFFAKQSVPAVQGGPAIRVAPTATLLLERVEDLVKELPPQVRARLGDPVSVARRMESACAKLRARGAKLDAALAEIPASNPGREEFVEAREHVGRRLAACTSALEQLRTDLLRLNAGLIQADGLTFDLEKAQELGAAIDAELHGHDEVRRLLA